MIIIIIIIINIIIMITIIIFIIVIIITIIIIVILLLLLIIIIIIYIYITYVPKLGQEDCRHGFVWNSGDTVDTLMILHHFPHKDYRLRVPACSNNPPEAIEKRQSPLVSVVTTQTGIVTYNCQHNYTNMFQT